VLILAGAGSGKTRVITYRIAYLIEKMGVMPESILAMTFTNKAASEMAERVEKLVGGLTIAKPVISTFHSFCVRVLRRDIEALRIPSTVPGQPPIGHTKNFVIYDESDQQQVVKGSCGAGPRRQATDAAHRARGFRGPRITCSIRRKFILQSADPKTERSRRFSRNIARNCSKANAMDFDDLLLEATRLLKSVAAVREYYNRRFQYLLVDEYQDTNRPQYELMRCWRATGTTFARWAMKISRSTRGGAPTFATFLSSSRIFPKRRSCAWSRTTARRRTFWERRRRWSRTTSGARARIFGLRGRAERKDRLLRGPGWRERGTVRRRHDQIRAA
jgi:superfamily I DNA/RNA helicase